MLKNKIGISLVANSIQNTSRLFKIAEFLTINGRIEKLTIVGFWNQGLLENESYTNNILIVRVKNIKQILGQINNNFIRKCLVIIGIIPLFTRIYFICVRKRVEILYCHDILMVPVALLVKLTIGSTIIYMPHELETEETGSSRIFNLFLKLIENIGMKYFKYTTVVSQGILEWYKNTYKTENVGLIRNIPNFKSNTIKKHSKLLRSKLGLSHNDIIFIYQGLIENSRGVFEIANTFSILGDCNKHLVFMGYGPGVSDIKKICDINMNIHYLEAVKPSEIYFYTSDADIGILFIPQKISLSYKYSLPNKYFEYVKSGIPILLSDNLPSIQSEVNLNHTGWNIAANIDSLRLFITEINRNEIENAKLKVKEAEANYDWDSEVKILLEI
jgi:hypothetical protein